MTKKQIPTWYKLFIERKIQKLEKALTYLDQVETCINTGHRHTAKALLEYTKEYLA